MGKGQVRKGKGRGISPNVGSQRVIVLFFANFWPNQSPFFGKLNNLVLDQVFIMSSKILSIWYVFHIRQS